MSFVVSVLLCSGVSLAGDDAPVQAIQAATPGLRTTVGEPCVSAQVREAEGALTVSMADVHGRTATHRLASPRAAGSLIESWLDQDLVDPLLAPRDGPPAPAPVAVREPAPATASTHFVVGAGLDFRVGNDGSLWNGGRVWGCVEVSGLCLGFLGRVLGDDGDHGPAKDAGAQRLSASLLLRVERPFTWGPVQIAPHVGAGIGFVSARDRRDDREHYDDGDLRAELGVQTTYPLFSDLSVDLDIGATVPFLAQNNFDRNGRDLPGAPDVFFGTSLGLRWDFR